MSFFQQITKYFHEIENQTDLIHHRSIIEWIFKIDKNLISDSESVVSLKGNLVVINIRPVNNDICPFYVILGRENEKDKVMFGYNYSGALLEMEIKNPKDLNDFIEILNEHLRSEVIEELTYINDQLVKSKYTYFYASNSKKLPYPFSTYHRWVWFWKKKQIRKKNYRPWLRSEV